MESSDEGSSSKGEESQAELKWVANCGQTAQVAIGKSTSRPHTDSKKANQLITHFAVLLFAFRCECSSVESGGAASNFFFFSVESCLAP